MISKNIEETGRIAKELAAKIRPHASRATVVALHGDLGSGKTTFTKYFAEYFGIPADEVTSPTFVIEKRFQMGNRGHFHTFIHIDAYRLEKPEEIERLGWRETLSDKGNLILMEWPANIGIALPRDAIEVAFKFVDENTREIVFN